MADFSARADLLLAAADAVRSARKTRTARPPARPPAPGQAIADLRRSHDELAHKVEALQRQANTTLLDLLQGFSAFERRFRAVKAENRAMRLDGQAVKALAVRQAKQLAINKINERVQTFTSAATTMQTAAYGQKGAIWQKNNVLLAGNQLLWTFADPLLRKAGFLRGPSPSLLAVLAPAGMLVTGHVALGNQQHIRFISGIATIPANQFSVVEALRNRIADGLWPAFERRTDVPVTVAPLEATGTVIYVGVVRAGLLRITASRTREDDTRVAWMVDTGADIG
jgi:hypothetical protein